MLDPVHVASVFAMSQTHTFTCTLITRPYMKSNNALVDSYCTPAHKGTFFSVSEARTCFDLLPADAAPSSPEQRFPIRQDVVWGPLQGLQVQLRLPNCSQSQVNTFRRVQRQLRMKSVINM